MPSAYHKARRQKRYSRWKPIVSPSIITIENYCSAVGENWKEVSRIAFKERIYRFYRWLKKSGLILEDITLDTLQDYRRHLKENGCSQETITQYMRTINPFLKWLYTKGMLGTTLVDLELEREKVPLLQAYLSKLTHPYAIKIHKIYGYEFHDFLKLTGRKVEDIRKEDLRNYEQDLRTQKPPRTVTSRRMNMRCVHNHIRWLVKKGHLQRSFAELGIYREKRQLLIDATLPDVAKDFLELALFNRKARTISGYKTKLRHFYRYLNDRQISLSEFTRKDFDDFAKRFYDAGYKPATIEHAITTVQQYLTWLYQCGFLGNNPEPIIGDFPRPRRADTLPRYLLPEVDEILQKHLDNADDVVSLALALMRRIGIRMGDLMDLRYDSLEQDDRGYWFLKIPLGKLNMERLFPLDEKALSLVQRIKPLSLHHNGGRKPEKLVIHPRGKPPSQVDYYKVLYEISEKIRLDSDLSVGDEPLVSHRLRHTFATSLLNADMSLEGVQKLLGHRSISMTLKYARVMPKKLREDYLKAVEKLEKGVSLPTLPNQSQNLKPIGLLEDLLARLNGLALEPEAHEKLPTLIRRTKRLKTDLETII